MSLTAADLTPLRTLLAMSLQVSLHTCPRAMYRELCHVFPDVDLSSCLAVATSQRANMDLVSIGDRVEIEKLRLLNSVSAILFLLSSSSCLSVCDRLLHVQSAIILHVSILYVLKHKQEQHRSSNSILAHGY